MYGEMAARNITLVVPITVSVGAFGGPMQGGGHSHFTSYYGTIADQVVSLQVVTADGKFVTVDSENNEDLFFALRGGGGGKLLSPRCWRWTRKLSVHRYLGRRDVRRNQSVSEYAVR